MIQIVTGDTRPIFRQIVDGVRLEIVRGELRPGSRLPSVRALAAQLTVNSNTVARAYSELTGEGLIESRKGVGVFVCAPRQRLSDSERARRLDDAVTQFLGAVVALGYDPDDIIERVARELAAVAAASDST